MHRGPARSRLPTPPRHSCRMAFLERATPAKGLGHRRHSAASTKPPCPCSARPGLQRSAPEGRVGAQPGAALEQRGQRGQQAAQPVRLLAALGLWRGRLAVPPAQALEDGFPAARGHGDGRPVKPGTADLSRLRPVTCWGWQLRGAGRWVWGTSSQARRDVKLSAGHAALSSAAGGHAGGAVCEAHLTALHSRKAISMACSVHTSSSRVSSSLSSHAGTQRAASCCSTPASSALLIRLLASSAAASL